MSDRPTLGSSPPDGGAIDVFVSYCRDDRARIGPLVRGLEAHGFSVWCDARLEAGQSFDAAITRALRAARVVLVCWSSRSVESEWVRAEATEGRMRKVLASCLLEACAPFPPFNLVHHEDLTGWRGEDENPAWRRLVASIGSRLAGPSGGRNLQARKGPLSFVRRVRFKPAAAAAVVVFSILAAFQLATAPDASLQTNGAMSDGDIPSVPGDATSIAHTPESPPSLDQGLGPAPSPDATEAIVVDDTEAPEEAAPDSSDEAPGASDAQAGDILLSYEPGEVILTADAVAAVRTALVQAASHEATPVQITFPASGDPDLVRQRVLVLTRVLARAGVHGDRLEVSEGDVGGESGNDLRLRF